MTKANAVKTFLKVSNEINNNTYFIENQYAVLVELNGNYCVDTIENGKDFTDYHNKYRVVCTSNYYTEELLNAFAESGEIEFSVRKACEWFVINSLEFIGSYPSPVNIICYEEDKSGMGFRCYGTDSVLKSVTYFDRISTEIHTATFDGMNFRIA